MISARITQLYKTLIYLEVVLIFIISLVVSVLRLDSSLSDVLFTFPGQPKILIYPLIWYILIYINDGWDRSKFVTSSRYYSDILDAGWKSTLVFAAVAFLVAYPISRLWVFYNFIAITSILLIVRFLIRRAFMREHSDLSSQKYIYVGEKESAKKFQGEFQSLFGFLPRFTLIRPPTNDSLLWLRKYKALASEDFYGVVISYGAINDAQLLKEVVNFNRKTLIDVILISRIAPLIGRFEPLENPTLIRVSESSLFTSGAFLKRLVDVFGAFIGLILLAPVLLLTALVVKLSSKGPILYTDRRVGRNGNVFTFPKFRSMYQGADVQRADYIGKPDAKISARYKADPRITPFGRFIRRWSIDELPQLWCVLIGTMSLVGPRPILLEERELVDPLHTERFMAKPGLTGLWQITGRKEVAWEDRMLRDLAYIESWSLSSDLVFIAKTFRAIIRGEGAY